MSVENRNQNAPGVRHVNPKVVQDRIRRDLKDRLGERQLNDPMERAHGFIRSDAVTPGPEEMRTIRRAEIALKRGEPEHLNKQEVKKWLAAASIKENWLKNRMVSKKGIGLRKQSDPDFQRNVRIVASVEMSADFVKVANEWKNIMRTVYPNQPEMANLERIRPN